MALSHSVVIEENNLKNNSSNVLQVPGNHPLKILNAYCKQKSMMTIEVKNDNIRIKEPVINFEEAKNITLEIPKIKSNIIIKKPNPENEENKELDIEILQSFLELNK